MGVASLYRLMRNASKHSTRQPIGTKCHKRGVSWRTRHCTSSIGHWGGRRNAKRYSLTVKLYPLASREMSLEQKCNAKRYSLTVRLYPLASREMKHDEKRSMLIYSFTILLGGRARSIIRLSLLPSHCQQIKHIVLAVNCEGRTDTSRTS